MSHQTPLMRQYAAIKHNYPDALLLFQVGDFYELFYDDAIKASSFLGITLTKRGSSADAAPLCGVPVHTIDHYLIKLVRGGFKVALCDQLTQPIPGKVVERGVTHVITPGTIIDASLLPEKNASYLMAYVHQNNMMAIAYTDVLTNTIYVTCLLEDEKGLEAELIRCSPDEILVSEKITEAEKKQLQKMGYILSVLDQQQWKNYTEGFSSWHSQLNKSSGIPSEQSSAMVEALSLLYCYLRRNQPNVIDQLDHLIWYAPSDYLVLDATTQRNLELFKNLYDGSSAHTLFSILDNAVTGMGSRCIKNWLSQPLSRKSEIEKRLDRVSIWAKESMVRAAVRSMLKTMGDVERVVGRIALLKATPQDYRNLKDALQTASALFRTIWSVDAHCSVTEEQLASYDHLAGILRDSINDDQNTAGFIKSGYHVELDRMRLLVNQSAQLIAEFEKHEQARTGIASLKVRAHQSYGYGIEITKNNLDLVPSDYIRLQSLTQRERFTSPALKELEYEMRRAVSASEELDKQLFEEVKNKITAHVKQLRELARACATIDALCSFGETARFHGYVRPNISDTCQDIIIKNGKHPVVAALQEQSFVPNDVALTDDSSLYLITGPNMGGKSTYMRQIALICIMAHVGCFVPATAAHIPVLDRIFTRIGASDNVSRGESTFLVEMKEAAVICQKATAKSLIILDEVGRGTSTHDGLALAQAIIEYIQTDVHARCLFATHYHELVSLCESFNTIKPFKAATILHDGQLTLLHKIVPGVAERSFGIEVAQMAGMPARIIHRARQLLL
jgi:DNA mismatch repair protein MutS